MTELWHDARYAVRGIRRAPGVAIVVVLTMALGIGATTAIFSVVNAVLLRPLPYADAGALVVLSQFDRPTRRDSGDATPANFIDWQTRSRSFTGLAAVRTIGAVVSTSDRPERVAGAMVTPNFFEVMGVRAAIGRTFDSSDARPGAARVAVLSNGYWRERFGGRSDAIGRTLRVDDEQTTIVGVAPPGVDYPDAAALWVTSHWRVPDDPQLIPPRDPSTERGHGYFFVVGRLRPGVSIAAARGDMDGVAAALEREYPNDNENVGVNITDFRADLVASVRPTVTLLFGAVALLLSIATANVSGILLARSAGRRQEIAIRAALGATRRRIVMQLMTESVILAALGGGCGVLLAMWCVGPLVALSPASLNVAGDVKLDSAVLTFALVISVATGLLFGVAPARQLGRVDVNDALKETGRGSTGSGQRRLRALLVVGEIAISMVLLAAAGLTIRSFARVQEVPLGFDAQNVVSARVAPPTTRYPTPNVRANFYERTVEALQRVPGVSAAAATSRLPLQPGNSTRGLMVPGLPPGVPTAADYRTVSPDYFRTLAIPVLRGRAFTEGDREGRPLVAIVSASLAVQFWPGQDPIGRQFSIDDPLMTVVGVVGDIHSAALDQPVRPTVYVPYRQDAFPAMTFVVRTNRRVEAAQSDVRRAIETIDPEIPVDRVRTLDAELSNSLSRRRFGVTLLTVFGVSAAVLAAIGLYGVLAFLVAERRREIGVRMALGATVGAVVRDVLGQGLRLAGLGVGAGLALAAASTRLVAALLFGTSPIDAVTFAAASLLLVAVAVGASVIPALRAGRTAPVTALREG